MVLIAAASILAVSYVRPTFGDTPRVVNVVPWNNGDNAMLNVTIYHGLEGSSNFVNDVTVDIGGDVQSFPESVPHTYYDLLHSYFNVTVGPVTGITGTPTATVKAHCSIHGWSVENWSGQIPEFSSAILLTVLILCSGLALGLRKRRQSLCS